MLLCNVCVCSAESSTAVGHSARVEGYGGLKMTFDASELRYSRWCLTQFIQPSRVKMDNLHKRTDAVHAVSLSPSDPWLSSTALWWRVWTGAAAHALTSRLL